MSTDTWERLKQERAEEAAERRKERSLARRTPIVAMKRLRCPSCKSTDVKTTRTLDHDAEIVSRRQRCRHCGLAFITIFD